MPGFRIVLTKRLCMSTTTCHTLTKSDYLMACGESVFRDMGPAIDTVALMRPMFDVCITSHPPRFSALREVLRSLETQSLYPDRILVFLSASDLTQFELSSVSDIKNLLLFSCKDLGPGKKLLPRLTMGHDRPIIVLDDDLQYDSNLLRDLVDAHVANPELIIGSRVHRVVRTDSNEIAGYYHWDWEFQDAKPDWGIFPTSGHGTLYPPGCFAQSVFDFSKYSILSFHTDDLWYFFHSRIAGTKSFRLRGIRPEILLEGTQESALGRNGNQIRNDVNLRLLINTYGDPEKPRRISHRERVGLFAQKVLLRTQVRRIG
jgi:glycosyltransferase involved in cell wall biosynthesis